MVTVRHKATNQGQPMGRYKSICFLASVIAIMMWASPVCAAIFEGPNGEIYYGDYLPQELYEKGYRLKDPASTGSVAPSEQLRPFDKALKSQNQNWQDSHEAIEGIDFINTSNYANTRLEFYYYIPVGVLNNRSRASGGLIAVPGSGGRGEHFVTAEMKKFADEEHIVVIAPSFVYDRENWNSKTSYQYPDAWSGMLLLR